MVFQVAERERGRRRTSFLLEKEKESKQGSELVRHLGCTSSYARDIDLSSCAMQKGERADFGIHVLLTGLVVSILDTCITDV